MAMTGKSGLFVIAVMLLAACGGGGTDAPQATVVAVSGRITFDRVPFKTTLGSGLDFANTIESPARGVVVDAVDNANATILATTITDAAGNYALTVPGNRDVFLRAKTQMLATGSGASWNFRILNNTGGSALYVLDSQPFNTGASAVTRNLRATSGWNGVTYSGTRAAAPFAILDTLYQAKELLLSVQPALAMPALNVYWSTANRPAGPFCPSTGNIGSTAYQRSVPDGCTVSGVSPPGVYVQGDFANGSGDTDEFDQFVVAHEFAHYLEDMLGRTDSIGGSHGIGTRLDLRVALSEGFGNAFAAMVLNDPLYRDSFAGANADFYENIEASADPNAGWFSESTVQQVLWDAFDAANEAGDTLTLGFAPLFQTLVGPQRTTLALTDLHSFVTGLKTIAPASAAAIDLLLTSPPRNITGTGDFATGETNNGSEASVLPIYPPLMLNQVPVLLCTTARFNSYNRLGNRKFFRVDLGASTNVTITVTGQADPSQPGSLAATDPDAVLWRQGARVWIGNSSAPAQEQSGVLQLQSGTYVLEVYDYAYADPNTTLNNSTLHCMTVTATG